MTAYVRKMLDELDELVKRRDSFEEFIMTSMFDQISKREKKLIRKQFHIMNDYIKVLKSRINLEMGNV